MDYETDFVDAGLPFIASGVAISTTSKLINDNWVVNDEFAAGEQNARWFKSVFDSLNPTPQRPVRIYLPEGRYYLGLPMPAMDPGEQLSDILIPADVTLVFGPKATLVPLAYTEARIRSNNLRNVDWIKRQTLELPESEWFRVRVEIQGKIDADLDKIFDPFLDDDRSAEGPPPMPRRRGGTVFFTRDNLRAVYPEWWGAVPKRGDDAQLTAGEIRRTTVALQSCFDAVLHHRVRLPRSAPRQSRPSTGLVYGFFALEGEALPFAPILWRFSGENAGRLILMGCRFDFPDSDTSLSVRGTPGASAIVDLGVLRGNGRVDQISVDTSTGHVEIPTWPHWRPRP